MKAGIGVPSFVLIDHSIADLGGHHYEYAVRVLRAAEEAGYTPILATNRKFKVATVPWAVYPVYRYGFWLHVAEPAVFRGMRALVSSIRREVFRAKCALAFSPAGMLWASRHSPGDLLRSRLSNPTSTVPLLLMAGFLYLVNIARAAVGLLKAAIPCRQYWRTLLVACKQAVRACWYPIALALQPKGWVLRALYATHKAQAFGEDTRHLFRKVRLEPGDIVFIPTLAESEMLGLSRFFSRHRAARNATWHLLFRRNIYSDRDPEYRAQDEGQRPLRNAFLRFEQSLCGQKVFYWTDTEQLTAQYNRLGVGTFHTLPIPVDLAYRQTTACQPRLPLRIVYAGDARREKGYHLLPAVVQDLWVSYVETGRVSFAFQSNYNTAEGEPDAIVARAQLQCLPADKVKLFMDPLDSNAYRELVLGSDVVLILYDRDNYYARSSGILVEALTAGKPVVVPAGTWMAIQLQDAIYAYHQELLSSIARISTHTLGDLRWHVDGAPEPALLQQGWVAVGVTPVRCQISVPRGTTHLLVSTGLGSDASGRFVRVIVNQFGRDGSLLARDTAIVGGRAEGKSSVLVPILLGVRRVQVGLCYAFGAGSILLSEIRADFLRTLATVPVSSVGCIYADDSDIVSCLKEIVEHYEHYRMSAQVFSDRWSEYHNPASLVRHLVACQMPAERLVAAGALTAQALK